MRETLTSIISSRDIKKVVKNIKTLYVTLDSETSLFSAYASLSSDNIQLFPVS